MAITNVWTRPQLWMPAYNPIVWSFLSDKITEPNFSYVVEVWIALPSFSGRITTLYQRPSASGNCMVDVSAIVQSYLSLSNFYGTEIGTSSGNLYAKYGNQLGSGSTLWNACLEVYLVVGEQYNVSGVPVIFDGSGAQGSPGYTIVSNYSSSPVRAFPGAIPNPSSVSNIMSTSVANSFASPYIMDGNGLFLTRLGTTQSIMPGQHTTLSFLNQWDSGSPGTWASTVQGIQMISYNAAGGSLGTQFLYNNTANGGGPQTNDAYTSTSFGIGTSILRVNVGTSRFTQPAGTAYYTVQAFRKSSATSSNTPGTACSALYRFNLVSPPCSDLYPTVRVAWFNDLGGMDYYNFTMLYEKSTTSEGETYNQSQINWDGAYPFSQTITGDWWLKGGKKSFNKIVTTRMVLQTDWLTQAEVDALGQIPESPLVWAYIGQNTNEPVSLIVTNTEYTYSNVAQQKLVQVTLEAEWDKIQPKQNM